MSRHIFLFLLFAARLAAQVAPGMSESDLLAEKGAPTGKISVGSRTIYKWPDMTVTLVNGLVSKVTQVQVSAEASEPAGPQAQPAAAQTPFSGNFRTHWQDESQYIVENTASDIAEMFVFARTGKPPAAGQLSVDAEEDGQGGYDLSLRDLSGPATRAKLAIRGNIFSPDTYMPLLAALAAQYGALKPADGVEIAGLLESLTAPTAETVESANLNVSSELAKSFSSARAHEQAALVLAAFSLREHSGKFYQILAELSRMSAHLSFAAALRGGGESSMDGKVAEAAMLALLGNSAESQALLLGLPDSEPGVADWRRALGIRNTLDVRKYEGSNTPSLLEQFERFHAVLEKRGESAAWGDVLKLPEDQRRLPDWGRIASSDYFSVGVGHELLKVTLQSELAEVGSIYELVWGKKATTETLVADLNASPSHCVTLDAKGTAHVNVIGWGLWAAFFQRHLCNAITSDFDFLQRLWGVPDQASAFRTELDKTFWGLDLYPFVRRLDATEERYYRSAQDAEMALVRSRPQVVPAEAWNYVSYTPGFCPRYYPPPHPFINEWHKRNPPPGTAYNIYPRLDHPSLMNRPDTAARLEKLHSISPWDVQLTKATMAAKYGTSPSGEELVDGYKDISGYDAWACSQIADAYGNQPELFTQWMARAAAINSFYFYELADFLKARGREAEAVAAYESAFSKDDNDVRVANSCRWVVKYYETHGRPADATKLADRAAEVGSSRGFETKGMLLEMRHDYKGALQSFAAINDRYKDPNALLSFLIRVHKEAPSDFFDAQLKSVSEQEVTGGIEMVNLDSFSGPPADGMLISEQNDETRRGGLQLGDVVVAVHGYRVRDFRSYKVLRELEDDARLDLILWRTSSYMTLTASPPNRRFGIDFADYHAR
jgi:tetratricopeptide (TPR) repeat protein